MIPNFPPSPLKLKYSLIFFFFPHRRKRSDYREICTWLYSGEGSGTPLQYSCLENPMLSRTRLSNLTFTSHFHALEKEMATHSSVLAWRIPGTGEPGGLLSMGSCRVRHDWNDLAAAAATGVQIYPVGGNPWKKCKKISSNCSETYLPLNLPS